MILTLVGLDIEGQWNVPLLKNAAELSGAALMLVSNSGAGIEALREDFDHILACETGRHSRSVYDYPAPRGRTALIVGNELKGISKEDLRKTDQVLFVPMKQSQMSSVNVAVAAAVSLYVLEKDLARKMRSGRPSGQTVVDVLLLGPDDSSELGSLLRSVWAFGWHKVFLHDPHGVWFVKDRETILAGRAAARREKNSIAIIPFEKIDLTHYDLALVCNGKRDGEPLSRLIIPKASRVLVVFGVGELPFNENSTVIKQVGIDYKASGVVPCYRHAGSTFLSFISECLGNRLVHG